MNNNRGNNNNNRRRGRGNNNRATTGGGQQVNRIDSRARGNAPQLLEKYRKLAQDAHLNGDRVQAEYYLQFADHYFRVTADSRVRMEEQRLRQNGGAPGGASYAPGYQNGGTNGGSVSGDHWQDQDGEEETLEFGMDANFAPGYERPVNSRRDDQPRRDDRDQREIQQREPQQRDGQPREYRNQRDLPRRGGDIAAPASADTQRGDEDQPIAVASDNPFVRDARGARGPRGRNDRNDRRVGRRDDADAPRNDAARNDASRHDGARNEGARHDGTRHEAARGESARSDAMIADAPRQQAPRFDEQRTRTAPRAAAEPVAAAAPLFDPSSLPPAIGARSDTAAPAPARAERTRVAKAAPAREAMPAASPAQTPQQTDQAGDDAPAAPKKRGRPRKTPLPDAQSDAQG